MFGLCFGLIFPLSLIKILNLELYIGESALHYNLNQYSLNKDENIGQADQYWVLVTIYGYFYTK